MTSIGSRWKDPVTWATLVIAGATVVNVCVAWRQWNVAEETAQVARDTMARGQRPYVGATPELINAPKQGILVLQLKILNVGSVPAYKYVKTKWASYVDAEVSQERALGEVYPTILFPNTPRFSTSIIRGGKRKRILSGKSKLKFELVLEYEAPDGRKYRYSQEGIYDPILRAVIVLDEREERL